MSNLVEISGVKKGYGISKTVFENLNLALPEGKIIGLLGPNGSGKTTLIKMLVGLLQPEKGSIRICGHEVGPESKAVVSYLPERTYLSGWMNVVQLLDFFCDFYPDFDRNAAEHMLTALEISPKLRIRQMSKGTREKVQLIMVMSRAAQLYLLDEPLNGIDLLARDEVVNTILTNMSDNASVVISSHLVEELERIIDKAIFMKDGQIVLMGDVEEIRQERGESVTDLYRQIYG